MPMPLPVRYAALHNQVAHRPLLGEHLLLLGQGHGLSSISQPRGQQFVLQPFLLDSLQPRQELLRLPFESCPHHGCQCEDPARRLAWQPQPMSAERFCREMGERTLRDALCVANRAGLVSEGGVGSGHIR